MEPCNKIISDIIYLSELPPLIRFDSMHQIESNRRGLIRPDQAQASVGAH